MRLEWIDHMLKIMCGESATKSITLKLEGRVIGPWVEEVRRVSEKVLVSGAMLTLDLSEVTFVDREGIELFRNLKDRQAMFLNSSVFVAEQLRSWEQQGR
jgi:anti-anti-sigma regulatory factor